FFCQAEDGIRDGHVTGVQTCALPISMGGAPKGYDAAAYGRDIQVFRAFLQKTAPGTVFLGPGSVGEGPFAMPMGSGVLKSEDLLHATGPAFDVFSYHLYASASQRCARMGASS